eukprot:TRINITY_DN3201_c0_g1_i9.p1 TRINITY_DN3201_c0_g1~~TRINITY_DN3201_c0_g1_i9.p1  ORF type:complete len:230 (+),score=54.83 TRINITY_DN3201_c0_g1_i9:1005-1694(+)
MFMYDSGMPLELAFDGVDASAAAAQADMLQLQGQVLSSGYATGPLNSWISDFLAWSADSPEYASMVNSQGPFLDPSEFSGALQEFLAQPEYQRYEDDLVLDATVPGGVSFSRVWMYTMNSDTKQAQINAMLDVRDIVDGSSRAASSFAFSAFYINTETDVILMDETLLTFGVALLAIFVLRSAAMAAGSASLMPPQRSARACCWRAQPSLWASLPWRSHKTPSSGPSSA